MSSPDNVPNVFLGTDTGSANAYAISYSVPVVGVGAGNRLMFVAANTNTGASTLALSGGTAIAIKKQGSTALAAGDITAGQIIDAFYDGTYWQLLNPGGGGTISLTTTGSSGAATLSGGVLNIPVYTSGGGYPGPISTISGCVMWLDASQLTGYSDGNSVVSWDDMARGFPLGVISGGTAPVYKTNIINSLPVIRFAGSSTMQNIGLPVNSQQYTIFMVLKISSLSPSYTAVWGVQADTGFFIKSNGKTALYFSNSSQWDGSGSYTFGTSSFQVLSLQIGPTSNISRVALAADATNAFTASASGTSWGFQLGNQNGQSGRGFSGDIAEVLMYSRNLTSSQLSSVENYLKTKYGL